MPEFTLHYWPIPFRGHPIRFILAHHGADWDEADAATVAALKDRAPADKPYPFLAPPLLHDRGQGVWLSQMPAIAIYLGRRFGLTREPDQSLRLICDLSDILLEITRYHGALMWDRASWAAFRDQRLALWMQLHERMAAENGVSRDAGFLFGGEAPGTADLCLGAVWHTMIDRLPGLRRLLHSHAPTVEGLADRIADLPRIAMLRAKWQDSKPIYCAGQIEESLMEVLAKER